MDGVVLSGAGAGQEGFAGEGFLQTRQLVKRFEGAQGVGAVLAVDDVSLSIRKGEIFALLGSSGCGKSTLLRMLAGFEKPTSGSVILNGVDIALLPPYERPINMMFQSYALFPHLSVWDNIAFGLKREGMPRAQIEARVDEMLKLVRLSELAKREGYRARAAYKLKEIDESFGLIKPGHLVVDLGSVPGAWSQYLRRKFSPKSATSGGAAAGSLPGALIGSIIALDILPMEPIEGVVFLQGDFREAEVLDRLVHEMAGRLADVVVSDMAPNLSGIHSADAARVEHLVELAIDFTKAHMKPQGALVAKVFHGSGYDALVKLFKQSFLTVKPVKPKASRDKSSETFLVGIGLK